MKGLKKLNAKQRRNLLVGGVSVLFLIAAISLSRPGVLNKEGPPVNAGNLLGSADPHALGIASIDNQVGKTNTDLDKLKAQVQRLEKQNEDLRQGGGAAGESSTPVGGAAPVPTPSTASGSLGNNVTPGVPVPTVNSRGIQMPVGPNYGPPDLNGGADGGASAAPTINTSSEDAAKSRNPTEPGAPENVASDTSASPQGSTATPDQKSGTPKIFIPAGTMLTGVLLTGVDAPTGREAASQPVPILARIKEDAILPNEYRADYRECLIVASAVGDLSSERAYARGETLSCVAKNGGVIQAHVEMWGTGEDGKAGMRGTLVSKQGSILAKAALSGFASGLGRAFTPQQQTTITTGSGSGGYSTIPLGTAGRMAGLGGMSSAADQVAQYYLKLADSQFPVIEISAGRPITFIVERGTSMSKLEDSK